jgi:preprotein translocase subunit YajC
MSDSNDVAPADSETPQPAAPAAGPPKKKWTRYLTPALALVAALVVGGVAGVFIGQSTAQASPQRTGFGQNGGFPRGEGFGGGQRLGGQGGAPGGSGGFTAGTIESVDGGTLTLKLADGSTVKVTTSDSTRVSETTESSVSKLKKGDTVTVIGQKDSSGDVTADSISEGQGGFGGFRAGRGGPTSAPTD